jgi:hypothetical protein
VPDDVLIAADAVTVDEPIPVVPEGRRNNALFKHCMRQAHRCDNSDALVELARVFNTGSCTPPLTDDEVIRTSHRAFYYTARGENRFGMTGSWLPTETVRRMVADPYLCTLVNFLQAENRPNRTFWVADGLDKRLGWSRRKFQAARREAINRGFIKMVSKPGQGHPALYRFGPAIRRERGSESEGVS